MRSSNFLDFSAHCKSHLQQLAPGKPRPLATLVCTHIADNSLYSAAQWFPGPAEKPLGLIVIIVDLNS